MLSFISLLAPHTVLGIQKVFNKQVTGGQDDTGIAIFSVATDLCHYATYLEVPGPHRGEQEELFPHQLSTPSCPTYIY